MLTEIIDIEMKTHIAEEILRDLPEWFGIESALIEYTKAVKDMPFFAYKVDGTCVAFVAIEEHPVSFDMHVLGVKKTFHRQGIGELLVKQAENYAIDSGKKYMTVKTLSADHPDENYKKTRLFYEKMGYDHLEVFPDLWGKENPCLYMIKSLK